MEKSKLKEIAVGSIIIGCFAGVVLTLVVCMYKITYTATRLETHKVIAKIDTHGYCLICEGNFELNASAAEYAISTIGSNITAPHARFRPIELKVN